MVQQNLYRFTKFPVILPCTLTFYSWDLHVLEIYVIQWWSLSRNVVNCTCLFVGCSLKSLYSPNSSSELFRFEQRKQTRARYPDSGLYWKTTKFTCACSIEVDTLLRAPDWTWKFRNSHLLQQPLFCVWSNLEKPQWIYSYRVNSHFAIRPESIWDFFFFSFFF